jgi:exopolyphosphatase/guanosine-5'-triphosphate,3'-diphosphate pyrophosphatase
MTEPQVEYPQLIGCVDTGSNAIRFLIAEFHSPTRFTPVKYERVPIRLGHQVFLSGRLAQETMDATVAAFSRFRTMLDEHGVQRFRAVATSAVREAQNGAVLAGRIQREAGIDLEVISGSEEARLVRVAVASRIELANGQWILCDVGGGSVEVSLVDDVGMLWAESHTMGSVRLLEVLSGEQADPGKFQRLLTGYVNVLSLPSPESYLQPKGFIATGGNIEALADFTGTPVDPDGVARLSVADLRGAIELLSPLSFRDKVERFQLREDRADVILPAAMVYLRVAEISGAETILVPHVGVKEGILLDLMDDLARHRSHEGRQLAQLTSAAVALGRRYLFDERHGVHVAQLATSLFEQLSGLHGLGPNDHLVLRAAAVLHDVGLFISYKRHHKHSLYILLQSDLPGLSEVDMRVVANVARYHRKRGPKPHHVDYMSLPPADRMRVNQLAGILRLADALDRQHLGKVSDLTASVRGLELVLEPVGEGDLLLERWAVTHKQSVFEETFGLRVRVEL